jgi:hypothetical protein
MTEPTEKLSTEVNLNFPHRYKITIEDLESKRYGTSIVEGVSVEACIRAFEIKAKEWFNE